MVSDQELGKKEIERTELILFLEAHESVTGERISPTFRLDESPDFICLRADGTAVGIELTRITQDRERAFWDRVRFGQVSVDPYETQETMHFMLERKERARIERYSKRVDDNILVLELVDGSLDQLRGTLDDLQEDFTSHGFSELWLADYSDIEAYGDIELFGLFPAAWWGYHKRPWPDRKPFG